MQEMHSFVPKGAIAFLFGVVAVYAAVWLFFFKILALRNG